MQQVQVRRCTVSRPDGVHRNNSRGGLSISNWAQDARLGIGHGDSEFVRKCVGGRQSRKQKHPRCPRTCRCTCLPSPRLRRRLSGTCGIQTSFLRSILMAGVVSGDWLYCLWIERKVSESSLTVFLCFGVECPNLSALCL